MPTAWILTHLNIEELIVRIHHFKRRVFTGLEKVRKNIAFQDQRIWEMVILFTKSK